MIQFDEHTAYFSNGLVKNHQLVNLHNLDLFKVMCFTVSTISDLGFSWAVLSDEQMSNG